MIVRRFSYLTCLALSLTLGCASTEEVREIPPVGIGSAFSARFDGDDPKGVIKVGDVPLRWSAALRAVYGKRGYEPVWIESGEVSPRGVALAAALGEAREEGLSPERYRFLEIESLLAAIARSKDGAGELRVAQLVDLELLLANGLLGYATDLSEGRIDPDAVNAQWEIRRRKTDPETLLRGAAGAADIQAYLQGLRPVHPLYAELKREMARYLAISRSGKWTAVPLGRKLEKGVRGRDVAALKARLAAEGYIAGGGAEETGRFDAALAAAVRDYQRRNGLDVDGVAGPETLAALNVPADSRLRQIQVNLERLRWLPRTLGDRYLLVDIAGFRLIVFESDRPVLTMGVIVGRESRPTPIFSDRMNHVVFNPFWRVPHSIAVKDELPDIKQDPEFFATHEMEVFRYERGGGMVKIDPATVDWSAVTEDNFRYFLRQKPGAMNALGHVKFMFPNRHSVYLHDTPTQNLFRQSKRTFSSGCVRVARPIDLGAYLMAGNPGWDRERFAGTIAEGKTRTITLKRRLPIHLVYLTAWAEAGKPVEFRRDIYDRDAALLAALFRSQQ